MTITNKALLKVLLAIGMTISLWSCQQNPKVSNDIKEVNALLRNITIEALKSKDYDQAQRSINALILNSEETSTDLRNKSWGFIQSAIISLPQELAIEVINNSLKNDSVNQSSNQLFGIAKVYISFKMAKQALKTINKAVELDNNNLEARFWRARLLTINKEYDKAEQDFNYILKKDPKNESYSGQYASFLQETKQFDKAQEVLSRHKATPDGLFKRIVFALQNKNLETANKSYDALKNLSVTPEDENNKYFLLAEASYWLEKHDESLKYYKSVSGGKHYLDSREMLTHLLFEDKKYDEAIELLHQLQNAEESYAVKAYRLESQIYKEQEDIDEAILTLTNSLDIIPNNPDLLYDRAMLYESQGKIKKLKKDLLQIIKDNPEHYNALNSLGYSLADHDMELEQAYEYIQKALELDPDNSAIIDSLGWAQYKLGRYEEAEKSFNKALSTSTNDLELYIHLYKTLLKLNKESEANALLEKAQKLFPNNPKIPLMQTLN